MCLRAVPMSRTQPIISAPIATDVIGPLRWMPPFSNGLSKKSPTVAPRGRTRDTFVK